MKNLRSIGIVLFMMTSCMSESKKTNTISDKLSSLDTVEITLTDGFDYPVGKPDAKKYYNAQEFGENMHLGDDWNGVGGGNTDLGDPIYSIANGYVSFSKNVYGGWGNVIRIVHFITEDERVESLYAHCDEVFVKEGEYIKRGQKIGTIGNNAGAYLAHLHLELRSQVGMPLGGGYSSDTKGYLDPTKFIKANRTNN